MLIADIDWGSVLLPIVFVVAWFAYYAEKKKKARLVLIQDLACTWKSPLIEDVKDVVVAYFTGLPGDPYKVDEVQAFSVTFERGSSWAGVLSECSIKELKTRLLVTFRPNARRELDWSFRYDVPGVARLSSEEVRELRGVLGRELEEFREYFLGFCAPFLEGERE